MLARVFDLFGPVEASAYVSIFHVRMLNSAGIVAKRIAITTVERERDSGVRATSLYDGSGLKRSSGLLS